jgi:hypothetical protein
MRRALHILLVAAALGASWSCSSSTRLPPPFIFNSPGDVEMVCFDTRKDVADADVVLPWACCVSAGNCPVAGAVPVRHALVTQVARGEVAAVDLVDAKVLDSERRVPGYTFVDVGGLPTAIVVPPKQPGSSDDEPMPPTWTFVAGREVSSVRAIATCRFRVGRTCGPEPDPNEMLPPDEKEKKKEDYRTRTELVLPEPPNDMLLDPGGAALWVSLPNAGVIARVDLASDTPFALDDEGNPRAPTLFELPNGVDLTPPDPLPDPSSYVATCGLGYAYQAQQLQLPLAPRAASTGQAEPRRMRLVAGVQGPLLVVADSGQAVLHALAIVEGGLEQRALLALGAPLRDFAVTNGVPAAAPPAITGPAPQPDGGTPEPDPEADGGTPPETPPTEPVIGLADRENFAYADPPPDDRRYLYGIDARDGSLMAFAYSETDGVPALLPLEAPMPTRNDLDVTRNLRDRLAFDGTNLRALDIVDTRALDPSYCGEVPQDQLKKQIDDKKSELSHTRDAAARAALQAEIDALQLAFDTTDDAHAAVLRGVFLIVAASNGSITVLDVHDLNLQCRARKACEPDDPIPTTDDSDDQGLAVQRHAVRLLTVKQADLLVSSPEDLDALPDDQCPDGYYRPETTRDMPVCAIADPWQARDLQWLVDYEARLGSGIANSVIEPGPEEGQLLWRAPAALDFCARGVNADDDLVMAVVSAPSEDVHGCDTPSSGHEPLLHIEEAYSDRLVVTLQEPEGHATAPYTLDDLLRCYPEFIGGELRLNKQYLASFAQDTYLHRNHAEQGTGRCVANEQIDERWSSRVKSDLEFKDPWVMFRLQAVDEGGDPADIAPSITLNNQVTFLRVLNVDSSSGRADALPSRVRYFSDTGDLFVVDGASQGLRRYTLDPFEADSARFR